MLHGDATARRSAELDGLELAAARHAATEASDQTVLQRQVLKLSADLRNFEALEARLDSMGSGLANAIVSVKAGSKTESWQIDSISGATISSKAVARMLNDTAQQALPVIVRNLDVLQQPGGAAP
mgnify:CR=1 FL=1